VGEPDPCVRPATFFEGSGLAEVLTQSEAVPWQLEACINSLLRHNFQAIFVDLSRRGVRVPVFKVFSPELCHIKPRFGKARLFGQDNRDLVPIRRLFD